jgi:hypothetical protein
MMVVVWGIIHAALAAIVTSWSIVPPNSRVYDLVPPHILAR